MSPGTSAPRTSATLTIASFLVLAACSDPSATMDADGGIDPPDLGQADAAADTRTDVDATPDTTPDMAADLDATDAADATDPTDATDTTDDVTDAGEPAHGSWDRPILIDRLPFRFEGDTRRAPSNVADRYACAPDTDEGGGEFVFQFAPDATVRVRIAVDDVRGDATDIDIHVLHGTSPDTCTHRHDVALTTAVSGVVHIVADTWVNGRGEVLAGPFVLTVTEADEPDPGECLTNPIECSEDDLPTPNGVPVEPAGQGGCPAGMARVTDFCIDRWEAALVTTDPEGPWSPFAHPDGVAVRAVSAPGLVPQGYISGRQASAACAAAGKRLCSDEEWLRACQGSASTTFPYGNTHEPDRCNEGRVCHPVVQYFESGADWIWSELGHPCINQLPDGLAPTGDHPNCTTEDGIFDMHGNLHEWTDNPTGIFRGGFYVDASINGPGCLYRTTAHSVGHWDYSTGFRCCAD